MTQDAEKALLKDLRELQMAANIADTFHGRNCCAALDRIENYISSLWRYSLEAKSKPVDLDKLKLDCHNHFHRGHVYKPEMRYSVCGDDLIDHIAARGLIGGVPEGYLLVPIDPTDEKMQKIFNAWMNSPSDIRAAYKAMIQEAAQEDK